MKIYYIHHSYDYGIAFDTGYKTEEEAKQRLKAIAKEKRKRELEDEENWIKNHPDTDRSFYEDLKKSTLEDYMNRYYISYLTVKD